MIRTDFEVHRAILYDSPMPYPVTILNYIPLKQALYTRHIRPDNHVLIAAIAEATVILPTLEMVYYHVAQGHLQGIDWVASFCALCNAGGVFGSTLDGKIYHFAAQGLYDAMTLIADQETRSFWNHLTGTCLHGDMTGAQLPHLGSLLQMTAGVALTAYPDAQLAIMKEMSDKEKGWAEEGNSTYRLPSEYEFDDELRASSRPLDERLPRFDMGLGLWTPTTQRYYPMITLHKQHNVLIDQVDARPVVVVLDPDVGLPMAFYTEAKQLEFDGDELLLTPEIRYRKGILYHKDMPMAVERPNQNAIRWYGFSSLFPNCEIYGQDRT